MNKLISKKKSIKASSKPFDYSTFFDSIKNKISESRVKAARQLNLITSELYWFIGKMIAESQDKKGWGTSVVENLSRDLKKSFPDVNFGFSERNLWDMRKFYLEYKDHEKLRRLAAEIGWSSNTAIINHVRDINAREYYLRAVVEMGWTRDILRLQIKSQAYEHHCLDPKTHNFEKALPVHLAEQADKSLKSIYSLEMLGLSKPVVENELRKRMVSKIKEVLLEFGRGFCFIGDEYRIVAPNGRESFIDLLCFNRILKSIICIEIKTGRFKPEYAGKMNYYLNLIDGQIKEPEENPSIGIILCTSKDHVDVEFALQNINVPVGVSEYRCFKNLPDELSGKLPDPDKLKEKIMQELGKE